MIWRRRALLSQCLLLLGALCLAGCASPGPESIDMSAYPDPPQGVHQEVSRSDLIDEQLVGWRSYMALDERTVRVHLEMGTCSGYRIEALEDDQSVRIAVYQGRVPGEPSACGGMGVRGAMLVQTEDPLADRKIIDATMAEGR